MAAPPLPDLPTIRARFDCELGSGNLIADRIFFGYSGGPAAAADLVTVAGDLATAWNANLAPLVSTGIPLLEVDAQDISTLTGASGVWIGSHGGSRSGTELPSSCCTNVQYLIARHYRGGKPKGFWPFGVAGDMGNTSQWTAAFTAAVNTAFAAFITQCLTIATSTCTLTEHKVLSYRSANVERATALSEPITGYATHRVIASQRRRRTSTTY